MKWFRDKRSERTKQVKKSIKSFYTLPSGKPKFKSVDEIDAIDAELKAFRSEDPRHV